ncbi:MULTISPECIES: hypothetical protein [Pseudofrankia]|uniref:hypothetical protein n=1 Tax=Pseudofrankia TaxID=2994363 RepID=UPI0018EA1130|nr:MULTISPECIES: hypothetical protein [Pseudofrankia]
MCLVVLGDPTVARAAAGTAFALVARTRMNPLSEPDRLRSWLLELARGSALAWSGSPQARSAPVPHGVSAEEMIDGAVVPAPTSLRAGLARTFDRAASAAAHERAAQERLASRTGYGLESSSLPIRTTGAAVAMAGAAAFAEPNADDTDTDAETRHDVAGAVGLGAVAAAGLTDAPTVASGAAGDVGVAAAGTGPAGSNLATAAAGKGTAAGHAQGGNLAQAAADNVTKAAHGTTKGVGAAHDHGGNAAQAAADHLTKATGHGAADAAGAHGHAVNLAKASDGGSAASHGNAEATQAAAGHGNAADAAAQARSSQYQSAVDPVTSPVRLPDDDVDPPTVDVDLSELPASNVVPFPAHRHDADGHYYADGQGAPLVPIDGAEGRRRHGPDWRTRPAIAVAASLVVAVAGITAALNWPAPTAELSAQDFPDVAIVAPSLEVGKAGGDASTRQPTPPGPTAAPTVGATSRPDPGGKPRLVSDDRPIATTTPAPPSRAGASSAPVTTPPPPPTTTRGTSSTPSPTRTTTSPTPSPTRTTTSPTPSPTRTTTSPPPGDGGAPTTAPPSTSSAPTTTPPAPPKTTSPPASAPDNGTASLSGTGGSGATANI